VKIALFALAVLAGLSNPIQSAANAGLNKALGSAIPAAFAIYAVALLGLLLCVPFLGLHVRDVGAKALSAPWWVWLGGLCNVMFVLAGALATRQIGSAAFTVTVTSCAIALSIFLDRAGALGLETHPVTLLRLLGGGMAIGGVVLVALS
jgi:transporter family-2 protein